MSIACALAEAPHHSSGTKPSTCDTRVVEATNDAVRGQNTVTRARVGEVREEHQALLGQTRLPPRTRPASLVEVRPQGMMVQHSGVGFELVQALNVPVLQMVEQPVEVVSFFRNSLPLVAEQVIEVPKLPLLDGYLQRVVPPEPLMAEQLVDVPTVHCFVEQTVDIPGAPGHGSPQGFLPGQSSSATVEQIVVIPVPRGGGARGGRQGFPQGRGASLRTVEQSVDTPVPGSGVAGGLQGFHPRPSSVQRTVEQTVDIPVPFGGRPFPGFHTAQSSTAFTEQLVDTGDLQGFHPEQGFAQCSAAQNVDIPVPDGRGTSRCGGHQFSPPGQGSTAPRGRRFAGQVFLVPDAAGRTGFIECLSAQAELDTGSDFVCNGPYLGRFAVGDDVWFSARQLPTGWWEAFDLVERWGMRGLAYPSPHLGCHIVGS